MSLIESTAVPAGLVERFARLSREFALQLDTAGQIVFADACAQRLFGACVGKNVRQLAALGNEEKAARLAKLLLEKPVAHWELQLAGASGALVAQLSGEPAPGGAVVIGTLVPDGYLEDLNRLTETLGEVASLHRKSEDQRREIIERQAEVRGLRRDLGDSERGVRVLHQEIEEKSDTVHQLKEQKSRLVANVSHELRTPLNSILGLTRILLDRADGELTDEQEKQINFIRRSAESLSLLVNDLLDIARIDAGKMAFRPSRFAVSELLSGLRGTLKPLATNAAVELVFEEPAGDLPELDTDEGKLSQILRNLVSNALKFTERGEVRITTSRTEYGAIAFAVRDTGVGIPLEYQQRIFEEFYQAENPLQRRVKGTGLGLSLSRRLATVLGGELRVKSAPGEGSTFTLIIPPVHPDVVEMNHLRERSAEVDPSRSPVLVVEDDRQTLLLYEKYLRGSGFQVIPARSIEEARAAIGTVQPAAVVLDVMLEGESSWRFLQEMKERNETKHIPVLVVTVMNREDKARALGADEFCVKPIEQKWLLKKLRSMARAGPVERVLVVDDDEVSRYLVKKLLAGLPYSIFEAATGPEGVRLARAEKPDVIILDFVLPDMTAFEVLDELKRDPNTRDIPVIISTAQTLTAEERSRLEADTAAVLSKQSLSREVAIARIRDALRKSISAG